MSPQISLAERYREVAKRDRKFEIFGAEKHKYLPKKVSDGEIKEFELVIGCELPQDYREFLLRIGTGVGPYYGLWSFDNMRKELNSIYEDYQHEYKVRARPCDPFELEESVFAVPPFEGGPAFADGPKTPGGFLPICHQGCEYLSVMVVTGVFCGKIFETSAFASTNSQWKSAEPPPGIAGYRKSLRALPKLPRYPSLSEWFAGWAENALLDLEVGNRNLD